jgi:hypothetical protein
MQVAKLPAKQSAPYFFTKKMITWLTVNPSVKKKTVRTSNWDIIALSGTSFGKA